MAKMIKCKTCGADIAKSAKTCPSCGAKNKKSVVAPMIGLVVLIGIAGAIGGSGDEPVKTSGASSSVQSSVSVPAPEKQEKTTFGIGETVTLHNVSATLLSVTEDYGTEFIAPTEGHVFVVCEFEIENGTSSDVAVSSALSFEAYFDDYAANLDLYAMSLGDGNQLDGTVAAGKKIKGSIGYQAPADWSVVELHFSPSVWSGKDIVFTHTK